MLSTLISKALFSFQFIKDLHSWPLTSAHGLTWTEASWDFLQALTANHLNGFSALFSMSVSVDDKNSSRYIIAVSKITKTHVHKVWLIDLVPPGHNLTPKQTSKVDPKSVLGLLKSFYI